VAAPFGKGSGQHSHQDASDGRTKISALAEFADSGEFGKAGLDLLRRVVRHELSRLPVLLAGRALDDDVAWDFVGDFFVEKGHRVAPALLAESEDDASLERQLRVIVRNWLIDKVRETDQGSVGRRIREVLEEEDEFERVPDGEPGAGRWRLVGTAGAPWGGRLEDLVAAAYGVAARAVRWSSETRRAPIAPRPDLVAVLKAITQAAGYQSLELLQFVAVIMRRFPATLDPEAGSMDLGDDELASTDPTPETIVVDRDEEVTAAASAVEVFAQLTPSERRLLLMIDDVDAVRAELGCGRSTAYNRIAKLRALVLELGGRFDDPEQVLREVLELCAP
jgi:hypothetical protein